MFALGIWIGYRLCQGYIEERAAYIKVLEYVEESNKVTIQRLELHIEKLEHQLKEERLWAQTLGASLYDHKDD
jgi:hypothetical protein